MTIETADTTIHRLRVNVQHSFPLPDVSHRQQCPTTRPTFGGPSTFPQFHPHDSVPNTRMILPSSAYFPHGYSQPCTSHFHRLTNSCDAVWPLLPPTTLLWLPWRRRRSRYTLYLYSSTLDPLPLTHSTSTFRTDGQTDGRLTIAIPRFALRVSRGKNDISTQTI